MDQGAGFFMEIKNFLQQEINSLNIQSQQVIVEAGHIYSGEKVSDEHQMGLMIGRCVAEVLEEIGLEVSTMLFIDDYNGSGESQETLSLYQESLNSIGFEPKEIVYETSLTTMANDLILDLKRKGKVKKIKERDCLLAGSQGLIDLWRNGKYSCSILDAALYLTKAQKSDGGLLVTVLPKSYREQQRKTKLILSAMQFNTPILNVYFNADGKIEVDFDY